MKIFVTQFIALVFKKIFLPELLLFVLFFSMSLQAETRYLFPGDIVEQVEPTVYETNRAHRHSAQRHWLYAKDVTAMQPILTPVDRSEQDGQKYPHLLYASDLEQDNSSSRKKNKVIPYSFQNQARQEYPNLLYVSDIEPDKRLSNQKAKAIQYSLQKTKEQNRSISAPLFHPYQRNTPRMLRGIFTGIIPPSYGYSNPNYNYGGLNNRFLNQFP